MDAQQTYIIGVISGIGSVFSLFSLVAEVWLWILFFKFKLYSPIVKLIFVFSVLHFLIVICFLTGFGANVCEMQYIGIQVLLIATWINSCCIATYLYAIVYFRPAQRTLNLLLKASYGVTIAFPVVLAIILAGSGAVHFGEITFGRCFSYAPAYIEFITYVAVYFITIVYNFLMFGLIVKRITETSSKASHMKLGAPKEKKKIIFYMMLFFAMGLIRLGAVFFFIYTAAGIEPPIWTLVVLEVVLPLEGFILITTVSFQFSLFRRFRMWCNKKEIIDNDMEVQDTVNSNPTLTSEQELDIAPSSDSK